MQTTIIILILSGILVILHILSRGHERREVQKKKEQDAFMRAYYQKHRSKKP